MRIGRERHRKAVEGLLRSRPVVALLGARQVGKTTLGRAIAADRGKRATFFDLEDDRDVARLAEPTLALEPLRGLVVLDEIQRRPELYPALRVLADRPRTPARFLLLGSASPDLLKQSAETLAGRIAFHELGGFDLSEVGSGALDRLWFRGGFPDAYLPRTHKDSHKWRVDFIRTFVERDIPNLGIQIPATTLARFWTMLAHYHGQLWNGSELAGALGVSHPTVRSYLDLLVKTFVVEELRPWTENVGKRVVKSPRIYVADSGLLHAMLQLPTPSDLLGHPKAGASWEGFIIGQLRRQLGVEPDECYFWRTHAGAELDLLVVRGKRRLGFEIKRTDRPRVTKSMMSALDSLALSELTIIHAGKETFPLTNKIRALAACNMTAAIRPLR